MPTPTKYQCQHIIEAMQWSCSVAAATLERALEIANEP